MSSLTGLVVGASRDRVISRSLATHSLMLTPACKLVSAAEQPAVSLLRSLISMMRRSSASEGDTGLGMALTARYKPGQCLRQSTE